MAVGVGDGVAVGVGDGVAVGLGFAVGLGWAVGDVVGVPFSEFTTVSVTCCPCVSVVPPAGLTAVTVFGLSARILPPFTTLILVMPAASRVVIALANVPPTTPVVGTVIGVAVGDAF